MNKKQLDIFDEQPLVRVDVNIPAVRRTLSAFASNRREALTRLSNEVCSSVADGLNQLLNSEMSLLLGQSGQAENERNGYRSRD